MTKLLSLILITSCSTIVTTPNSPNKNCPSTIVVNKTSQPWTATDKEVFFSAENRCSEIYKESPCLKYFAKVDFQSYHAICSR